MQIYLTVHSFNHSRLRIICFNFIIVFLTAQQKQNQYHVTTGEKKNERGGAARGKELWSHEVRKQKISAERTQMK